MRPCQDDLIPPPSPPLTYCTCTLLHNPETTIQCACHGKSDVGNVARGFLVPLGSNTLCMNSRWCFLNNAVQAVVHAVCQATLGSGGESNLCSSSFASAILVSSFVVDCQCKAGLAFLHKACAISVPVCLGYIWCIRWSHLAASRALRVMRRLSLLGPLLYNL